MFVTSPAHLNYFRTILTISFSSVGHVCEPKTCANGGHCVRSAEGSYHCQCLPAWTGPFCTKGKKPTLMDTNN